MHTRCQSRPRLAEPAPGSGQVGSTSVPCSAFRFQVQTPVDGRPAGRRTRSWHEERKARMVFLVTECEAPIARAPVPQMVRETVSVTKTDQGEPQMARGVRVVARLVTGYRARLPSTLRAECPCRPDQRILHFPRRVSATGPPPQTHRPHTI